MSTTCQQLVCFDNGRIWVEGLAGQINLSPWWFQLPSVLGSSTVVVDSLFIVAPIDLKGFCVWSVLCSAILVVSSSEIIKG